MKDSFELDERAVVIQNTKILFRVMKYTLEDKSGKLKNVHGGEIYIVPAA
jgi:hypothetical protein